MLMTADMSSPFLADYGLVFSDRAAIQLAFDNIRLYRDVMLNASTGLWMHIIPDESDTNPKAQADRGLWVRSSHRERSLIVQATGNGWVLGGLVRTKAAILKSDFANDMTNATDLLYDWATEIVDGMLAPNSTATNGLVKNYMDRDATAKGAFGDPAASSMLAWGASHRRLALLTAQASTAWPCSCRTARPPRRGISARPIASTAASSATSPPSASSAAPSTSSAGRSKASCPPRPAPSPCSPTAPSVTMPSPAPRAPSGRRDACV